MQRIGYFHSDVDFDVTTHLVEDECSDLRALRVERRPSVLVVNLERVTAGLENYPGHFRGVGQVKGRLEPLVLRVRLCPSVEERLDDIRRRLAR